MGVPSNGCGAAWAGVARTKVGCAKRELNAPAVRPIRNSDVINFPFIIPLAALRTGRWSGKPRPSSNIRIDRRTCLAGNPTLRGWRDIRWAYKIHLTEEIDRYLDPRCSLNKYNSLFTDLREIKSFNHITEFQPARGLRPALRGGAAWDPVRFLHDGVTIRP